MRARASSGGTIAALPAAPGTTGARVRAVLPRTIGLGALLVLLLGAGLVLSMSVRRTRPWTVLSTVLCLALGSFLVLRDAVWLTVLVLVVVGVLVTTALTDARRLVPMVAGAASWVLSAVRGLPSVRLGRRRLRDVGGSPRA